MPTVLIAAICSILAFLLGWLTCAILAAGARADECTDCILAIRPSEAPP